MSVVDYGQTAEDHQSLLILVRHTGSSLPLAAFNRVWERIRALSAVTVQGQSREVAVRYKRGYPKENNDWGDFQAHRKVLGLVAVGKCVDHEQFADLFENYKKVKEDYASTIINSRLIIFGMNTDGSPIEQPSSTTTTTSTSTTPTPQTTTTSSSSPSHHHHYQHQQHSCHHDNDNGNGKDQDQDDSNSKKKSEEEEEGEKEEKDPSSTTPSKKNKSLSPSPSPKCPAKACSEETGEKEREEEDKNVNNSMQRPTGNERGEDLRDTRGGSVDGGERDRGGSVKISEGQGGNKSQEVTAATGSKVQDEKGSRTEGSQKGQGHQGGGGGEGGGRPHSNSLTKESTGSEVVFYPSLDQCFDLEERLKEFVTSLFFVLEGKRLERTFERSDRLTLLCAPFEKKDYVGVDTDTKSFKKKVMGRLRKHLGDLCLQASLPGEAMLHYQTALDLLRSVNDFLWMGGCYEGLCSASVVLTKAHTKPTPVLRRNQSFSVKRGTSSPDLKHKANTAMSLRQQVSVSNFSNGVDHLEQETALHCLNPDDIIEKYKEAITNYSKYKNSAMVEMEASMKACRVLIYQRKFLQASDFLQNVVYINLTSTEEDKIQRFSTLSWLYGQIGFRRKEAFFRRVAAMQCVTPGGSQAWNQCYQLLLHALPGYTISLDPHHDSLGENYGWPVIQHRVLHELVFTARRMGNPQIAVRHSTLLLHSQYRHLSPEQQREAVNNLQSLTSKCQGVPQPLTIQLSSIILPPIHLTSFPTLRSFKLLSPPAHLRPVKVTSPDDVSPSSIFIYTPLSLGNNSRKGESEKVDFEWVEGDMCEVQLQLYNPLALDLNILYMGLLTEGVEVEVFPASPSLPSLSPLTVNLMVKPQTSGQLTILGYDTQVFGVSSHCRLRDMRGVTPALLQVDVVPALPQVTLNCSLPKAATFAPSSSPEGATVVTNASAILFAGQSQDCAITLHNISSQPVTSLTLKLDCRNDAREFTDRMFQWSNENIQSQLPLQPGGQLCIAICLYAHSDFLLPPVTSPDVTSSSISSRSHTESSEKGTQTVEALLCVEYSGGSGLAGGYCRRCSVAVTVDIQPSLYITNWDVLPADCGRGVSLVLDLLNVSSHQADVHCDSSSSSQPPPPVIIESQQCRRIAVTIPRVSFPEQEDADKMESRIPVKYRSAWRTPDVHSTFLSTFVHIHWTMAAAKVKGKVGIDYLKWTPQQLDSIRQSDINWEVLVNGQHYTEPDLMSFHSSVPVSVSVSLSASKGNYQDVTLTVEPGQEGQGEGHPLDRDAFVCVGAQTVRTDVLTPDQPLHHAASFIFLCPGRYQFTVRCSARRHSSLDCMDSSSSVVNSQQEDSQYDSQDGGGDGGCDDGDVAVFVCLPPPLFTITDHCTDHALHL